MTAGRLSEMFGAGQVETDAFLRTLGWRRVAEQEYDDQALGRRRRSTSRRTPRASTPTSRARTATDISLEYAALGFANDYKPEKWTPVDSVAWLKAMAWDLRGNMQDEIDRSLMTSRLDASSRSTTCTRTYPYDRNKPIVAGGRYDEPPPATFDPARPGRRAPRRHGGTGRARAPRDRRGSAALQTQLAAPLRGPGRRSRGRSARTATASAPTPGSSPASTPPPASRCSPTTRTCRRSCRPSGTRWACTAGTVSAQVPVRRLRLHLLRHARRGHRPQPGHRLGHDQPRRRRHRPLPGEAHRRRLPVRRQGEAVRPPARRPSRSRAARAKKITVRDTNNGPAALRPQRRAAQGRREGPRRQRRPRPRRRLRRRAALDRAGPRQVHGRRLRASTGAKDFNDFRAAAARLRRSPRRT